MDLIYIENCIQLFLNITCMCSKIEILGEMIFYVFLPGLSKNAAILRLRPVSIGFF